jgi:hypothetical protein
MPECCFDPVNHVRVRIQRCNICGGLILDGTPAETIPHSHPWDPPGGGKPPLLPDESDTPALTSLVPPSAVLGSPDFTLRVRGTGFVEGVVIVFAGHDEPTTFVTGREVTTGVDMSVWEGPDPAIPVVVRHPDGRVSNTLTFAFEASETRRKRS